MKKTVLLLFISVALLSAKSIMVDYFEFPQVALPEGATIEILQIGEMNQNRVDYYVDENYERRYEVDSTCLYLEQSYTAALATALTNELNSRSTFKIVAEGTPGVNYSLGGVIITQSLYTEVSYPDLVKVERTAKLGAQIFLIDNATKDTIYINTHSNTEKASITSRDVKDAVMFVSKGETLHGKIVDYIAGEVIEGLTKTKKSARIPILKGKGKPFKAASEKALEGDWDAAVPVWESLLVDKTEEDALFNLYQYSYHVSQDFSKAAYYMERLLKFDDKKHFQRLHSKAVEQAQRQEMYEKVNPKK